MTTLLTGDLHLSDNDRDSYRLKIFGRLERLVQKHSVGTVVLLGDLTEEKDRHGAWLVNRIVDRVASLAKLAHVIWLVGNHDYIDIEHPFFRVLGALAGVEVVQHPEARPALSAGHGGAWGRVVLLPHTRDFAGDWQGLKFDAKTTYFAHNTFDGALSESGRKLEGIPLDVFPKGAVCYAGDVHVPQTVGPVTYVGAPYLIDFGDRYRPRMLLLDNKGKATSLVLGGPGKKLLELDSLDGLKDDHFLIKDDIVKVRVNLAAKDYADWPAIRKQVLAWGEKQGVQIFMVQPRIDPATVNQRMREADHQSDEELLDEYAKHRGIDKATLRTGKLLMEEAA